MTQWEFTTATISEGVANHSLATVNQRSLQRLIRAIALSGGHFSLILVRCNYRQLSQQIVDELRILTKDVNIREVFLSPQTTVNLHKTIISELYLDIPAVASDSPPSAVMVFGLESVTAIEDLLTGLNQARDIYADTFPFPLVLWLKDETAAMLSRLAPDFKSWAATTIKFEMAAGDLIGLIRQQTEPLFEQILAAGADHFLSNAALNVDPGSQNRQEITAARHDLKNLYNICLEPELEASLEFVLGRDAYSKDEIETAIAHYQSSLALWQQQATSTSLPDIAAKSASFSPHTACLRQGVVLFHIGLCYRRMADLRPALNVSYWREAHNWFERCIHRFKSVQRLDLVAKFVAAVCEMLQRLQAWDELEDLAQQALKLHQEDGSTALVAQDYGFLAAVAGARGDWLKAYELANMALSVAETAANVSRQQESWYLLLLGRAQWHLGESEEAINNLEWAKVVCELQYEPALYLEIVEELRSLYFFERRDYNEAFQLKQEKIQIEHQYGFRAFIGASQLQPQRYKLNPALDPRTTPPIPEAVAQEIAASGRQKDVQRLIERIARTDCKLTVVHGPSGVGKSSILKAGLVPTLQDQVLGDRTAKVLLISVYSDWIAVLARNLNMALAQVDLSVSAKFTTQVLLHKIRELTERNSTVVLIFDQLEEFFFVVKEQSQRMQFYKFIGECLNIPFVKIIFSLREDYLHHLLELERLSQQQSTASYDLGAINQNILDKDIRYYIGNFSVQEAIGVIDVLQARSHYELSNELINQLVRDLAHDETEVHPIELQIVGAQLQSEKITTLKEYQESGGSAKLVERWLSSVVKDCGRENEQLTWKILFELTSEKGTRPLRSTAQIEEAINQNLELGAKFDTSCQLILDILVGSGLILCLHNDAGDRYQLVHDYLVEPIRQKNNYGIVAELEKVRFEKTRAEVAQKISQEQLNQILTRRLREARTIGAVLATMTATIGGLWWHADIQKRVAIRQTTRAEQSEANLRIAAIAASSEALFASRKEFDALIESLRAWRQLQSVTTVPQHSEEIIKPDTRVRVITALQQAVYGVSEINRLEGHVDNVWGVAYSPDGKLIASVSTDKTLKIWRSNGQLLQTLTGHTEAITSVTFSLDGKSLITTSMDKTVRIWQRQPDSEEFQSYRILTGHTDWINAAAISSDNQIIVSAGKDGQILIWQRDGDLLNKIPAHTNRINWVTFSPDGQLIATAGEDSTIKIWTKTGELIANLQGHQKGVSAIAFSPDGQTLVTGSGDTDIIIWRRQSTPNGKIKFQRWRTISQHTSIVWSLAFAPDGKSFISAGDDNMIYQWNLEGARMRTFKGHSDAVVSVAFSPDGKNIASASYDKSIKIWRLDAPQQPVLTGHQKRIMGIAWSADGRLLASASRDNTVKLWGKIPTTDSKTPIQLLHTLKGHQERVTSVSFDPRNQLLATASYDKTIKLWRYDGTLVKNIGTNEQITSINFSPDGALLVSGGKDKTIKIWSREGQLLHTQPGHQAQINHVSFSPDGNIIASASDDRTVKLWRRDGQLLKTFPVQNAWMMGTSFSPTEKILATASWDNSVKLWKWDGTLLQNLLRGYSDSVNAVSFSPNGEYLAAANWDSTVKLWSRDGKLIKTLNGHTAPVLSVSFSHDGKTLASAGEDHTIKLWNLDLEDLAKKGCNWVRDYLQHNPNLDSRDRDLCPSGE
ncbi:nSTAND1 domain-containing NTPase [Calothrix sp. NIES-3974]|uniref:WD40 domain-containing protein n=1 Tax=Calothrix sp. NIES-3974 TaxID=2005462 RepID=UPI000B5E02B9|nr:hypothetical protein [Calothrix sp. NIES-3974]BAZ06369.1 WD-40 repeat-containing protein [Calothrix sp. NIES-3974]